MKSERTPLKLRHPERILCILGDPETSEETIEMVQSYLSRSSRIQIHVEHCNVDRFDAVSLRSASIDSKYIESFKSLAKSVITLSDNSRKSGFWDTIEIHANSDGMSDTPSSSVASRIMKNSPERCKRTPSEVRFPRIGAFEIIIFSQSGSLRSKWRETLIFSKLSLERWPDISEVSKFLELLIFGGRVTSILVLQRATRAHNARKQMSNLWKSKFAIKLQKAYRSYCHRIASR